MASGVEIYIDQLLEMGGVISEAIKNYDIALLRGLQCMDMSIWANIRGGESVVNTFMITTCDELDTTNPSKDKASKIDIPLSKQENKAWRGLSNEVIINTLLVLEDLGLIRINSGKKADSYGKQISVIYSAKLTSAWDPFIEDIVINKQQNVYSSSIGKLIGLNVAAKRAESSGSKIYGLRSWIPISSTIREVSNDPDGKITKEKIEEIFIASTSHGERKLKDFRGRDQIKSPSIRLIVDDAGGYLYLNRDAIRAYEIIRDRGMSRTMSRSI